MARQSAFGFFWPLAPFGSHEYFFLVCSRKKNGFTMWIGDILKLSFTKRLYGHFHTSVSKKDFDVHKKFLPVVMGID